MASPRCLPNEGMGGCTLVSCFREKTQCRLDARVAVGEPTIAGRGTSVY
jgi:hypothetical protein